MKIIHIADTHLGRAAFNKLAEDGSNLRESLIYDNFLKAIGRIIDEKPDVVVHAGDLFDAVKPKTWAYTTALQALDMLEDANIELVMVVGNHSMQKTAHTICPFEVIIPHKPCVTVAYSFRYERFEIQDTIFHLIPNMLRAEDYLCASKQVQLIKDHHNVLVTHGLVGNLPKLSTVAEFELNDQVLLTDYDYIALGHYHGQTQVAPNAWYSGSLEHLTYGEISDVKGGLEIDLGRHEVSPLVLPKTSMYDLGVIDCEGVANRDIVEYIADRVDKMPFDEYPMVQATLDYGSERVRTLPTEALADLREDLLDLKIRVKSIDTIRANTPQQQDLQAIDYVKEFSTFLQQRNMGDLQRAMVEKCGIETLKTVSAQHLEAV